MNFYKWLIHLEQNINTRDAYCLSVVSVRTLSGRVHFFNVNTTNVVFENGKNMIKCFELNAQDVLDI